MGSDCINLIYALCYVALANLLLLLPAALSAADAALGKQIIPLG